ncbi:hypothetical protein TcWFU_003401 [Taenia crassiceps]|uniref:Prominin-like protein n=1 Tax=Taenia crassiceps TaxID=6207 RepID=A0ABR4Q7M1_9CEST
MAELSLNFNWLAVLEHLKNYELPTILLTPIFKHFPGYMGCLMFGLLFAFLLPLVGIFFCCLRCCGRCGGRLSPMDRKADPYRRVCYTVSLALLITIQLASIVLAFINYQLHYESVTSRDLSIGMAPQLTQSTYEFQIGIADVVDAAKSSSSVNLVAQKERFDAVFDAGLQDFQRDFVNNSSAAAVLRRKESLQKVVYKFAAGSVDAIAMSDFLEALEKTSTETSFIQATISDILNTECTVDQLSACRRLRFTTDNDLKLTYTLEQFQSSQVANFLRTLESVQQSVRDLDNFNATLLRMKEDVKKAIQPILDDAWNDLSNAPKTRENLVKTLEVVAETARSYLAWLNDLIAKFISSDSSYVAVGNEYILYSGFAFLCLPAFIILLFYLGLSFGVCGDRPHEEASFCNRGVGANLLLSGVVFTFLLSSLLMLACTVVFLSGGLMQTEVCRYATHRYPGGPAVLDDALEVFAEYHRQGVRLSPDSPPLAANVSQHLKNLAIARPFSVLLTRCANESLVDSLGDKVVGMMVSDTSIDNFLESILVTFNGIDLIGPLRRTAADTLNTLSEVHDLQSYNFSEALMKADERLTEIEDFDSYVSQLESLNIASLNDQIMALQETVGLLSLRLKTQIRQLYAELQSIRGCYNQLVDELNRFSSELDRTVPTSIGAQIESMRPLFLKELRLAVIASWRDIPCTRLYSAATTGVHAACVTFLDPLNGLWFGLGLFLLLCIPVLVFGVKLVNLYRKTEKYSPDYEQPDYISYHAFYMRPATSDGDVQSRRKHRPRKGKSSNRSNGKADNGSAYGFSHRHGPASNSTYQTVSVYPYDAYE